MKRYAWVLNLDAELELARGRPGYVAQRKLTEQLAEHGHSSRALLGREDVLLDDAPLSEPADCLGRAWCPTPLALAALQRAGIQPEPYPSAEVLRQVNHRLFAHALGGGLAEQRYVTNERELAQVIGDCARRWLLKRPLTFAGRGQLRVIGPLTEKQRQWTLVSLARDGLVVEPLVVPTLEVSLHGFVWRDARYELGRICAQDVTLRGTFRGVRLAREDELESAEIEALRERAAATASALGNVGYFGPFGIDGYRYESTNAVGFCALSEINARYTLGFVTGFPRHPSELSLE